MDLYKGIPSTKAKIFVIYEQTSPVLFFQTKYELRNINHTSPKYRFHEYDRSIHNYKNLTFYRVNVSINLNMFKTTLLNKMRRLIAYTIDYFIKILICGESNKLMYFRK